MCTHVRSYTLRNKIKKIILQLRMHYLNKKNCFSCILHTVKGKLDIPLELDAELCIVTRSKNLKYSLFSSGSRTHNLLRSQSHSAHASRLASFKYQLSAVSRTQQGRQREPSVKTPSSQFSI